MAENSITPPEPDIVYTESQVSFRRDLVLYSRPVKNYDFLGNDCFIVHFINGHEMRLLDESEIAQVKMYLGYPPD